jgi:hypothetical protein
MADHRRLAGSRGAEAVKYAIDTEFIDTPAGSELISLAVVREDGEYRYYEFDFDIGKADPWLKTYVLPHLIKECGALYTFGRAASELTAWINKHNDPHPEFWAYYATHDWYWLCRDMGGMMRLPAHWPHRPKEFADYGTVPAFFRPKHHALADARSLMKCMFHCQIVTYPEWEKLGNEP